VKAAFIDASAGAAGDMLMAALVDAGARAAAAADAIAALDIAGLGVEFRSVRRAGLRATYADVHTPADDTTHRSASDVYALIDRSPLSDNVKVFALKVFSTLISAEAQAHGVDDTAVHLHETGSYDSIADVVGVSALLEDVGLLAADAIVVCSPIAAGSGTVRSAHGLLPVPVPAVLNILDGSALTLAFSGLTGECTTPTGAAILASCAVGGTLPALRVQRVGLGAGTRDTPDRPNVTRVVVGELDPGVQPEPAGDVELIECTVDDLDPQFWPEILTALRNAGALDCWTTRITGRHGRPGEIVSALTVPALRAAVVEEMFAHTGTFGVRSSTWHRDTLDRITKPLELPDGSIVEMKIGSRAGRVVSVKPEPAQVFEIARTRRQPARTVRDEISRELRRQSFDDGT